MEKYTNVKVATITILLAMLVGACDSNGANSRKTLDDPVAIHEELVTNGLSCDAQSAIDELDKEDVQGLGQLLKESMSSEEFLTLMDGKESNCAPFNDSDTGTATQALAPYWGNYTVEWIDDDSIGGGWTTTTGWEYDLWYFNPNKGVNETICGEDLDDGVWEVDSLAYSFQYRQYLRFTGNDNFGACVETWASAIQSRIYTDDSIRMCVRSTWMSLCGVYFDPHDYSFIVGFQ